jgi:hypothetical protein
MDNCHLANGLRPLQPGFGQILDVESYSYSVIGVFLRMQVRSLCQYPFG